MVKVSILTLALLAAPVLSVPLAPASTAGTELQAREPFFKKIIKGAGKLLGGLFGRDVETIDEELFTREFLTREIEITDELLARDPFFKKILKGAGRVLGGLFGRDFESMNIEEREPFLPLLFGAAKLVGKAFKRKRDLSDEEFDAVLAREPVFDFIANREDMSEAELDELVAREPFFGFIKKIASKVFGRDMSDEEMDQLIARELAEEMGAIAARELSDDEVEELIARDPFFKKILKGAGKLLGGLFGREFDDEFVFERSYDELD